ncbi:MAG: hypothetical protein NC093_07290 [Alistipes sp.]|nr:hypothetical protein [Alistipes sp.]
MNILHCPKCGGEIIVDILYTLTYIKKAVLTDEGFDEYSDRIADECTTPPVWRISHAHCESCGKEWRKPFYEIGVNCNDNSVNIIELSGDEVKMNTTERKNYFLKKGIEIIS